ncbi:MAG: twin-arginine translocase TatA/TatE family subunit [Cytophagaceae bacterium]|jgi:sec-independent protein translocase protein TatA|nr:twin-arginine translocase TatA/TatE family subunit [Cytophagaceae bacterium]
MATIQLLIMGLGIQELLVILVIFIFLFGAKKIPELARGLGRGIREFKDASNEIKSEISKGMEEKNNTPSKS